MKKFLKQSRSRRIVLEIALIALLIFLVACGKNAIDDSPKKLETPSNLRIENEIVTWDEVKNADEYVVEINGKEIKTKTNNFDGILHFVDMEEYSIRVNAQSRMHEDSEWSGNIVYTPESIVKEVSFRKLKNRTGLAVYASPNVDYIGKLVIPAEAMVDGVKMPVLEVRGKGFLNCSKMTSIFLPDSIETIDTAAFEGCTKLERLYIPSSTTKIGYGIIYDCNSLRSLVVEEGNAVYRSEQNCIIEHDTNELVLGCSASIIPSSVTSIGVGAFTGANAMEELRIPKNVVTVAELAFKSTSLKRIIIEEGVKKIGSPSVLNPWLGGDTAFITPAVTEIYIPASVEYIALLEGLHSVEVIKVDEKNPVYYSEDNCLIRREDKTVLAGSVSLEIPKDVKKIGHYAFANRNIVNTELVIPEGVEEVGEGAFFAVPFEKLTLPSTLKKIGAKAFAGAMLTDLDYDLKKRIANEQGEIWEYGVWNYPEYTRRPMIKELIIPDGVEEIGAQAFAYCRDVTYLYIPDSVKKIGNNAFDSLGEATIFFTKGIDCVIEEDAFFFVASIYVEDGVNEQVLEGLGKTYGINLYSGVEFGIEDGKYYPISAIKPFPKELKKCRRIGYTFVGFATEKGGEVVYAPFTDKYGVTKTYSYVDCESLDDETRLYFVWKPN